MVDHDDSFHESLDEIDVRILRLLFEDGRMSYSELAKQVGISRPGVTERVAVLQRKGVIDKFTIEVPSMYVRKALPVFFDIRVSPERAVTAAQHVAEHRDIVTVYQMSSRGSLHVHGFFSDIGEVGRFVNEYLVQTPGVLEINTDFLLRRFKSERV